ncbi:right-handed parallel beta-helix repeat-containing protein [Fulvivirga maritima]|uniref:pectate lyase family protein n=1 Tax=Fulvivirga maritima TaxID=2904247 RepID=UPI001F3D9B52|nr:right-handed parallel beta-helix repeat-containing protein [Fulvivirga maritima]UII28614.1 right-handed parallel beta-helix repeat-containing protein [Fulvivirga maritima]
MKTIFTFIALIFCSGFMSVHARDIYLSPSGSDSGSGSQSSPLYSLEEAVDMASAGDRIYMRGGTYNYSSTIKIEKSGRSGSMISVLAYNGEVPVLSFSAMSENSSNRGIVLDGDYWHFKDIIIEEAGDNGMLLSGNNNIIEDCIFRANHDTGLQISRYNGSDDSISEWPTDNLILGCEAYNNRDSDNEDADGFAAKLTVGTGNVFRNCISHHNIDDGWDLYTKTDTGPIGSITLEGCIAHHNGTLTSGGSSGGGDKNGFKLGGSGIHVDHIVRRCIAYNNGKHGFTDNSNTGSIEFTNNTSYDNEEYNFHTRDGASHIFKNNLSYQSSSNDRLRGNTSAPNVFDNNDSWPYSVSSSDFVTLTPGPDNNPTSNGFLSLAANSDLINAGVTTSGITYNGSAPDLGALEYGGTTTPDPDPETYTLTVNRTPSNGGSVSITPNKSEYEDGETVTLTASANSGFTFSGWSGALSGSAATASVTMTSNRTVTAIFESTDNGGGGGEPGATVRIEDTNSNAQGLCAYDGSLKEYANADNGSAINLSNSADQSIVWKVRAATSGTYTLTWRYTNGGNSAHTQAVVALNGDVVRNVTFSKTQDKETFVTTSTTVSLNQGVNELSLITAEDGEFADVDWMEVSGPGVSIASCSASNSDNDTPADASIALSSSVANDEIALEWEVTNATFAHVEIFRDTDDNPSGRVRIGSLDEATTFVDETAEEGVTYYYWVKGVYTDGTESVNSNVASARIAADDVAEIALEATAGAGEINLSWSIGDAQFAHVEIFRDTDSDPSGRVRIGSLDEATTYTDATAEAGVTYYYWVKGVYTDGTSAVNSNVASAAALGDIDLGDFSMEGYATVPGDGFQTTTGGAGGSVVIISSLSELEDWASYREGETSPQIAYFSGKISSSSSTVVTIKHGANISILGLGDGAELENVGLNIRNYDNVIVRNLKIHEVFYPNDALTIDECSHVWIDHLELHSKMGDGIGVDTYDGLLDIKKGSRYVTVSWCYIHDHMKTSLIGHTNNSGQQEEDSQMRITYHHNYFYNTYGRNPSLRYGAIHMYNNYFNKISDYGLAARVGAHALVENCHYNDVDISMSTDKFPVSGMPNGYICQSGNLLTGDTGEPIISQTGCDWWNLPYDYEMAPASTLAGTLPSQVGVGKLDITLSANAIMASVEPKQENIITAQGFKVDNNYPNPFSVKTNIRFYLDENEPVSLVVYDVMGNQVYKMMNEDYNKGQNEITLQRGNLPAGIYTYILSTPQNSVKKRFSIVR